jgi:hypothetical protein
MKKTPESARRERNSAPKIGELLEMRTNAVEVALHRALARLRELLGANPDTDTTTVLPTVDEEFR